MQECAYRSLVPFDRAFDLIRRAALDPPHRLQPAVPCDIGRLGGPGRYRADTRDHEHARECRRRVGGAGEPEQIFEGALLPIGELALQFGEVPVLG